jgi:predicted DNA-binding transcriptional regulator AlpA
VARSGYDHDFDDDDGSVPWAFGADEPDRMETWDDADGVSAADTWLDEQLGRLGSEGQGEADEAEVPVVDAGGHGGCSASRDAVPGDGSGPVGECGDDRTGPAPGLLLRHPAPTGRPRRRRADRDGAADLPVAALPGYVRDRRGTWRYEATGESVPGARDLTLRSLYRFPARRGQVLVPVERVRSEAELGWCLAWKGTLTTVVRGGRLVTVLPVPVGEWERRADVPFGLWAPELTPSRLLGVSGVARLAGVSPATVTAYLSRRRMPPPVTRVGNTPLWSRPVIHHWLASRPGQGARPRR